MVIITKSSLPDNVFIEKKALSLLEFEIKRNIRFSGILYELPDQYSEKRSHHTLKYTSENAFSLIPNGSWPNAKSVDLGSNDTITRIVM